MEFYWRDSLKLFGQVSDFSIIAPFGLKASFVRMLGQSFCFGFSLPINRSLSQSSK